MLVDLDGTIIIEKLGAEEAWQSVCCEASPLLGVPADHLQAAIGAAADWFWADVERGHRGRIDLHTATREVVELALSELGAGHLELAPQIAKTFRERRDQHVIMPGSVEALGALQARGIALALITNGAGPVQRAKIEQFGLARFFQHVFIEGELDFGKPDERIYRYALTALGSPVSETWIVGDNLMWEVAVPQRLGFYAIWMDSHGLGLPADCPIQPDRVIRSLFELVPRD